MRITLNLATRPFADLGPAIKRLRIAMGVLAVVAIGLGVGLHALHRKAEDARARDHSLDGQIARITQERQSYQNLMRQPANAQVLTEVVALNKLFDEKSFSWTLAMEDLETVLPGGVQVSTLEPVRAKDGHITLHLRVVGPRDKSVDLLRNLEHSRRFLLPRITGENSEATGGPGEKLQPVSASNRVNFDLLADYNPTSPRERKVVEKLVAVPEDTARASAIAPAPVRPQPNLALPQQRLRPPYNGQPAPQQPLMNRPVHIPPPLPGRAIAPNRGPQ
ncbi:MAG: fimbrial assembly protein [Terracidiphilus sp.]|jgi:type IV pilus assembly protein PilN